MKRYNHAYSICFSLVNFDKSGESPNPQAVRHAILDRLASLTDVELLDAVGVPHDTFIEPSVVSAHGFTSIQQKA